MIELTAQEVERYLRRVHGPETKLLSVGGIGGGQGIKGFGYGKPLLVRFVKDGTEHEAVLSVMRGDKYGHQFYWDRAAILLFLIVYLWYRLFLLGLFVLRADLDDE